MAETAMVPVTESYIALQQNDFRGAMMDNLAGLEISAHDLDIVKAPSGGSVAFEIPSIDGTEVKKDITGILTWFGTPRAYYDTPTPVEGMPPTCFSSDGHVADNGQVCRDCPFNQFGTAVREDGSQGRGKACKEYILAYVLMEGNMLPTVVRIPPTSKKAFSRYMMMLASKGLSLYKVITQITLSRTTSKDGQPYSEFVFTAKKVLSDAEATAAQQYAHGMKELFGGSGINADTFSAIDSAE